MATTQKARRKPARERLVSAAQALFKQHGFENVTIAQIAETAGVTSRTFFRHFSTKEEVLFAEHEESIRLVEHELEISGSSRPAVEIVRSALSEIMRRFDEAPEKYLARFKLELSSPSVEAYAMWLTQEWVRTITRDLAKRLEVDALSDPRPHLTASLANMSARLAIDTWVARDGAGSIRAIALELFDLMTSGLRAHEAPS